MITFLKGQLADKLPPTAIINVGGVGYEVEVPMSTFYNLPPIGSDITLLTQFVVREDAQLLYGFASSEERRLFRELVRISGVGAKLALAVMSGMSVDDFVATVQAGDSALLTRIPGVGKKTAERLVVEMKDRLKDWSVAVSPNSNPNMTVTRSGSGTPLAEAEQALAALGYKPAEAARMLKAVEGDDSLTSEELIKKALQTALKR